jgi:hypothetical protein
MDNDIFPKETARLQELANKSTSFEALKEAMKQELERTGVVVMTEDRLGAHLRSGAQPQASSRAPEPEEQDGRMLQRAVTITDPRTGATRTRLLEAYSVHGLDILQQHFERES